MPEVTLKEYFNKIIDDLEGKLEDRFEAQQQAIKKAEDSIQYRLEGMNEFRSAMKDAASRYITRKEVDLKFEALGNDRKDTIALFVAIASLILSVIFSILKFIID